MSSRRTSVASSVAPRKPGRRTSSVVGGKGGSRRVSTCSSTGTLHIEDSPSSVAASSSSEESSIEEHRRKDLEWHKKKQEAQLKVATERRLKEKEERAKRLASELETGTSERESEMDLLEESFNQPSGNGVQRNVRSAKLSGDVQSDLKGKKAPPPPIESKLISRMKPFSELPQELWTKRVQPKPKTVPRPPPPEVLETSQADEPSSALPAVDNHQELNVPGIEKENGTVTHTPENKHGTNRTFDLEDSRANKRKSQAQTHVNADSKRQRIQQDNNTSSQTSNVNSQTYNNMTSTPYPNRTAKEPSIGMSPVTPDNDIRPSHLIPTQKVKTLARPPVRDQADLFRRLAHTNDSSRRTDQVQSDTEVRKQPPLHDYHNASSPQIGGNRGDVQGPSTAATSNRKEAKNKTRSSETQSSTEVSDHDSDDNGRELFSKTDSEKDNARAKSRSRSPVKRSHQSVSSATSTKSATEQASARQRKSERRRLREASLPKTFETSDEETAPRTDERAHRSRKVSVDQGQQESRRRQTEAPSQPPSAASKLAVPPSQELEVLIQDIFEHSVLPSHQDQNEARDDDNQPNLSPKVPEVISSKFPERRRSKQPSFIPIPPLTVVVEEPPPSIRTTRATSKAAPKSKKKSAEGAQLAQRGQIIQQSHNLIHSTSHEAPGSSSKHVEPPKGTEDIEDGVLFESDKEPEAVVNVRTTRAASKPGPKSKKKLTPTAMTLEKKTEGVRSPPTPTEDGEPQGDEIVQQRDNEIHSTSHHKAPATSRTMEQQQAAVFSKSAEIPKGTQDIEDDVVLESDKEPEAVLNVRTTRAASKPGPKSRKKSAPTAMAQGAKSPTSPPEDEGVQGERIIQQAIHSTSQVDRDPARPIELADKSVIQQQQQEAAVSSRPAESPEEMEDIENDVQSERPIPIIRTTRATSSAVPKSKKTPALTLPAMTQEKKKKAQGAKPPTSPPEDEGAQDDQIIQQLDNIPHSTSPQVEDMVSSRPIERADKNVIQQQQQEVAVSSKPAEPPKQTEYMENEVQPEADEEHPPSSRVTRAALKAAPKSKKKSATTAVKQGKKAQRAKSPTAQVEEPPATEHEGPQGGEPEGAQVEDPPATEPEGAQGEEPEGAQAKDPPATDREGAQGEEPEGAQGEEPEGAQGEEPEGAQAEDPPATDREGAQVEDPPATDREGAQVEDPPATDREGAQVEDPPATDREGAQGEEPPATDPETSWDDGIVEEPSIHKPDERISSKSKKRKAITKAKVDASAPKSKKSIASRKAAVIESSSDVDEEQARNVRKAKIDASAPKSKKSIASRKAAVIESSSDVDEEPAQNVRKTKVDASAPKSKKSLASRKAAVIESASDVDEEPAQNVRKTKVDASAPKPKKSRKAAVIESASDVDEEPVQNVRKAKVDASAPPSKKSLVSRKAVVVEPSSDVDEEPEQNVRKTRSNAQATSLHPKSKEKAVVPAKHKSLPREKSPTLHPETSDKEESAEEDEEQAGPSGSQLSGSSTRSRQGHRRSTFEIARSSSTTAIKPKKKSTPREEVTRYVGNDVFGNYHMLANKDFLSVLNHERPDHGLDEQQQKQLAIRINHFLEDLFTQECEDTSQPMGFVPFLNLKKVMVDQCLLEEDATGEDLLEEMKKAFSKEDWKRSEKVLYPSRYSRKGNNDDYLFTD